LIESVANQYSSFQELQNLLLSPPTLSDLPQFMMFWE